MGLGTLTVGTATYADAGNGRYINNANTFGGPRDEFKISRGVTQKATASKPATTTCSFTKNVEYLVTVNGVQVKRLLTVSTQIQAQDGITSTQVDAAVGDISTLITPTNLNLVLGGGN